MQRTEEQARYCMHIALRGTQGAASSNSRRRTGRVRAAARRHAQVRAALKLMERIRDGGDGTSHGTSLPQTGTARRNAVGGQRRAADSAATAKIGASQAREQVWHGGRAAAGGTMLLRPLQARRAAAAAAWKIAPSKLVVRRDEDRGLAGLHASAEASQVQAPQHHQQLLAAAGGKKEGQTRHAMTCRVR